MHRTALLSFLAIVPAFAQQPRFELADVHVSPTTKGFAQNFGVSGGVIGPGMGFLPRAQGVELRVERCCDRRLGELPVHCP